MTLEKKFQRKIENFTCNHCGQKVLGRGYTNHCPGCLWSQHVDVNPGDRYERCLGMMEPVSLNLRSGTYIIAHRCLKCGIIKNNRSANNDDISAFLNKVG